MNVLDAIILGLVQGFTEFLPVSSSGHLVMTQTLLGVPAPGVFLEVALHAATLLSVVVVYRARLWTLVRGAVARDPHAWGYIGLLALATVPAALAGLLLKERIEAAFDTPMVTGVMLLVTGVLLWSTRWARREGAAARLTTARALGIGIAQAFALLPGISRSGSTIAVGLWEKVDGVKAAEFSFLMSIPAVGGATVLTLLDAGAASGIAAVPLAIGFLAALVSGVVAIRTLVWLLQRQAFHLFAPYVWVVGVLFLVYLSARP